MTLARAILLGFIILASSLARTAYSDPPDVTAPPPVDQDKALAPGDTVSLQILEDKTPAIIKRITDTGDLDVPYINRIHVAGRTCAEVAAEITRKLEAEYYYKATVKLGIEQINPLKQGTAAKIFVSGEVKVPGALEILPGDTLTVSGAVVRSGGGTTFADSRKVRLTRKMKDGTSKSFTIDVKAVLESGKMDQDMQLQDGDYIYVPRRLITF